MTGGDFFVDEGFYAASGDVVDFDADVRGFGDAVTDCCEGIKGIGLTTKANLY